ncbi:hypothetical protein GCM10023149_04360 [Mucilaginibacter gynuensis]|uniref:TonB-dependent receptor plug domain-containing protein n=1 Tax=Mucilaginibacter gynuensis TaxID=1302236 RepID=A0ABP8FS69_9SPHI
MNQKHFLILFLLLGCQHVLAQNSDFAVSGIVRDTSGQILIGVTVRIDPMPGGVQKSLSSSTDVNGQFKFRLSKGRYNILCTYVGFQSINQQLNITADQQLSLVLKTGGTGLQEVVVRAQGKSSPVRNMEMGAQSISIAILKRMPALFGEVDVVRSVLTLPGVSSVGEGSSGFNVRGGNIDQNLVLMDGAPVFNTSHLFGLFSVFNPEVVQDVKLIKGGITSEYGGRLSSVMDIQLKNGNADSLAVSGGIGTVSARVAAGFPILKNKGTVFLAGRRTYADLFLKLSSNPNTNSTVAYFQDFNAKADYRIGTKDRISIAGYYGNDRLGMSKDFKLGYSNANAAITQVHEFSQTLSAKTTVLFSRYQSDLSVLQEPESFINKQHIDQYQLKTDWTYRKNEKLNLSFGLSAIQYKVSPGIQTPLTDSSLFNTTASAKQSANELGFYISNTHKFSEKLSAQYGARLSYFNAFAAQTAPVYTYGGIPGKELTPVAMFEYSKGASIKSYGGASLSDILPVSIMK